MIHLPVGFDCSAASSLRQSGLRERAYPFDWNILDIGSIELFFRNKGVGFLEKENLEISKKMYTHKYENQGQKDQKLFPVLDYVHGILFVHDYKSDLKDIEEVKSKYRKRINNLFHELEKTSGDVTLYYDFKNQKQKTQVLQNWQSYFKRNLNDVFVKGSIESLREELQKLYPNQNFIICNSKQLKSK